MATAYRPNQVLWQSRPPAGHRGASDTPSAPPGDSPVRLGTGQTKLPGASTVDRAVVSPFFPPSSLGRQYPPTFNAPRGSLWQASVEV